MADRLAIHLIDGIFFLNTQWHGVLQGPWKLGVTTELIKFKPMDMSRCEVQYQ